jgi:hypothetical protein
VNDANRNTFARSHDASWYGAAVGKKCSTTPEEKSKAGVFRRTSTFTHRLSPPWNALQLFRGRSARYVSGAPDDMNISPVRER